MHAPVVDWEMTPGPQPGSSGFESRRGYSSGRRGAGHPAGSGRRRSLVRLQPARSFVPRTASLSCSGTRASRSHWLAVVASSPSDVVGVHRGTAAVQARVYGAVEERLPCEPHELETWVRIPPARFRGRSSEDERSFVRREAAGSSPVVPAPWWPWCNGSIRGREPRGTGSNPVGRPFMWTLSIGELRGL